MNSIFSEMLIFNLGMYNSNAIELSSLKKPQTVLIEEEKEDQLVEVK